MQSLRQSKTITRGLLLLLEEIKGFCPVNGNRDEFTTMNFIGIVGKMGTIANLTARKRSKVVGNRKVKSVSLFSV